VRRRSLRDYFAVAARISGSHSQVQHPPMQKMPVDSTTATCLEMTTEWDGHPILPAEVLISLGGNPDQRLGPGLREDSEAVCNGCALGTSGLKDWTLSGPHLCNIRLRLLRLNTMPALDARLLEDVGPLEARQGAELRDLGRLPYPMLRRRGESQTTTLPSPRAMMKAPFGSGHLSVSGVFPHLYPQRLQSLSNFASYC
jgi:hypothetical protein